MSANLLVVLGHTMTSSTIMHLPAALQQGHHPRLSKAIADLELLRQGANSELQGTAVWQLVIERSGGIPVHDPDAVWQTGEMIVLAHPDGYRLVIGVRACILSTGIVWRNFLNSTAIQEAVRELCSAFAAMLGSANWLYLPNQYSVSAATEVVYNQGDIMGVKAWLNEHHGPPAPSINAIASQSTSQRDMGNGYFIDSARSAERLDGETSIP